MSEENSNPAPRSERVKEQPYRRKFAPEYKLRILQEIDSRRGEGRGVIGEILRREGLFASQIASWKNSLEEVIAKGLPEKKRGRKTDPTTQIRKQMEKLQRQNNRLQEDNRQMRLIIAAQKKLRRCTRTNFGKPRKKERQPDAGSIPSIRRMSADTTLCCYWNSPFHVLPVFEALIPTIGFKKSSTVKSDSGCSS